MLISCVKHSNHKMKEKILIKKKINEQKEINIRYKVLVLTVLDE